MKRTLDASAFNVIASHPEVRPWLGFPDPKAEIDLSHLVGNPNNYAFLTDAEDGGYILAKLAHGLYCAHTMAMPSARGAAMLKLMRDGFATMFTATDCVEIVTMVPDGADRAARWSKVAGFRDCFRREACFSMMGEMVGGSHQSLSYSDWVINDPMGEYLGKLFHERLDKALGEPNHAEDDMHNRWVGATIAGCIEGNLIKSIALYNRFAAQVGWTQAQIISEHPAVVDIGNGIVQLLSGRLDVLKVSPPARSASSTSKDDASCLSEQQ